MNVDKAFIQFAGLTAGRASSFFDFYAHDFEIAAAAAGSDVFSTNLLAYTATIGNGLSATISIEDPAFRRTPIFSPFAVSPTVSTGSASNFGVTVQPTPVFVGPGRYGLADSIEKSRMPDFVGVVRLDQAWGSAQISAATHELNVGNLSTAASTGTGPTVVPAHTRNVQG
ncbi:Porin subfamily protein [Methylobacterium sp. 190mf]|nr:Porin subfamily protein [Methylobacterium sp. 190mf]